jgi:hypothetical protein
MGKDDWNIQRSAKHKIPTLQKEIPFGVGLQFKYFGVLA